MQYNFDPIQPPSDPSSLRVAFLVPLGRFQSKWDNIAVAFIKKMTSIIDSMGFLEYKIYICDEIKTSDMKFNKGFCFNVAFMESTQSENWDYLVFNDIDYIPDEDLIYSYQTPPPPGSLIHIGNRVEKYKFTGRCWGAVFSIRAADFKKMNGFPNNYEGWGGEDNALGKRSKFRDVNYVIPKKGKLLDLEGLTKAQKEAELRQLNVLNERARDLLADEKLTFASNGLSNLHYTKLLEEEIYPRVLIVSFVIGYVREGVATVLERIARKELSFLLNK